MNKQVYKRILDSEDVFQALRRESLISDTLNRCDEYLSNNLMVYTDEFIALFALLFAEIAKPDCRQEVWDNESQSIKYEFPGLNQRSSRLAEDIMVRHDFEPMDIYRICWLIENLDVPMTDEVVETITRYVGFGAHRVFVHLMRGYWVKIDAPLDRGLIRPLNIIEGVKPKRIYFPIAASASGKSTICETMVTNDGEFLKTRYDSLRKELYGENGKYDYWHCIEMSMNDPEWEIKAESIFVDMLKSGKNILFDNCNVSYDDRRYQIKLAREYGYEIIALTIPIDLATLKWRQDHRRTKLTPWTVSEEQYFDLQQPMAGIVEFDYIMPLDYR